MTKTKNRITTVIIAAILAIAAILPFTFGAFAAYADRSVLDDEEDELYDKLYYFSDYDGCEDYTYNMFCSIQDCAFAQGGYYCESSIQAFTEQYRDEINVDFDAEVELNNWSESALNEDSDLSITNTAYKDFIDMFTEYYNDEDYKEIYNSFIIFEMRETLPVDVYDDGSWLNMDYLSEEFLKYAKYRFVESEDELFVNMLLEFFRTLQENGCKIMVIFGTDDICFTEEDNEYFNGECFLDYVDIFINLDVFYSFIDSVFCDIEERNKVEPYTFRDSVIVLDYSLSQPWFFAQYLCPYVIDRWGDTFYLDEYSNVWATIQEDLPIFEAMEILKNQGVHLVVDSSVEHCNFYYLIRAFDYNGNFISFYSDTINNYDVLWSNVDCSYVYAIATLKDDGKNFDEWEECIQAFEEHGDYVHTYLYTDYNKEFQSYIDILEVNNRYKPYPMGMLLTKIEHWLPIIIHDFVFGEDLSRFNNYDGACIVSYIPLTAGNGGWAKRPPRKFGADKRTVSLRKFVELYGGLPSVLYTEL